MRKIAWVAFGSGVGGLVRYAMVQQTVLLFGPYFPWGTLFANVAGSIIIGFVAALARPESRFFVRTEARLFLMVGFCGGLTTFSLLSWEIIALALEQEWIAAAGYLLATLVLGIGGAWAGYRSGIGVFVKRRRKSHEAS